MHERTYSRIFGSHPLPTGDKAESKCVPGLGSRRTEELHPAFLLHSCFNVHAHPLPGLDRRPPRAAVGC